MMKPIFVYAIVTIVILFLLSRSSNKTEPDQIHNSHPTEQTVSEWEEEDEFNLKNKIVHIFPQIDVDPTDQFISVHELTQWNLHHHTQREMVIYDKDHDGFVSFSDLNSSITDDDSFGYDMRLLEEEHFNASDADGDGLLNFAELNDFLHSANSNSPKLQQRLCKEEVRESDMDRDGKVSFREFFLRLFHLVRKYDEENYIDPHHSDDSMDASAKLLFSQLDKDCDGFLSDTELLPVIGKLHPSEHYYATKQSENFISQAQDNKDGHLSLTEMIENAHILYAAIFPDEFF
ncbi:calumenin-b-like protein [Trifolium pratense]|uniref:Calumenin-b-like protein n=1 Tax=Trifolium pratense TaxID=57577 RepID=A0A2K3KYS4_TRIPR|nr:calumenin-b-like protein [Trifolium pratense]